MAQKDLAGYGKASGELESVNLVLELRVNIGSIWALWIKPRMIHSVEKVAADSWERAEQSADCSEP